MPTVPELNAAYDALRRNMTALVRQFIPLVPFMFQATAQEKVDAYLRSPDSRRQILQAASEALEAAEKARPKT